MNQALAVAALVRADRRTFSSLCPNFTLKASMFPLNYPDEGKGWSVRTTFCFASPVKAVQELNNSVENLYVVYIVQDTSSVNLSISK